MSVFVFVVTALCLMPQCVLIDAQAPKRSSHPASYMVLYPSRFHMGSTYNVYVKMLRPSSYIRVDAALIYENNTEVRLDNHTSKFESVNTTLLTESITLPSGTQEGNIEIKIPGKDIFQGKRIDGWFLDIKGSGSISFENSTRLYESWYHNDRKSDEYIFIQTDKSKYKNGEKVRYRVFVVDRNMKPLNPIMDIHIQDPRYNKIYELANVQNMYGVSGELQLSEHPPLGEWKISVSIKNSSRPEIYRFWVMEYVLPKFSVNLKLPPFGTVNNPELRGKVTAKYTYGEPVKGKVTLKVTKSNSYWRLYEPKAIQTEFKIDGETDFSIAMKTLLKFDPTLKSDILYVEANVTEEVTGMTQIDGGSVRFYEQPLQLQFISYGEDNFKPGFKYTTYLKVFHPDNRPVIPSGDRVRVSVTFFTKKSIDVPSRFRAPISPSSNIMKFISPFLNGEVLFIPEKHLSVPRDGIIKLDIDVPNHAVTGHIEVEFKGVRSSKNLKIFTTNSKAYLNLDMKSAYVKVGDQATFYISSNIVPKQRVTYHVIREQKILETHYTSINSAFNRHTFYVTMTPEMTPECTLIAYFLHDTYDEIVSDGLKFAVEKTFQNDVMINFDKGQVSPGTNVSLHLRADAGSQVFVLAVDKSVLLMQKGNANDITQERVYSKLDLSGNEPWKYRGSYLPSKLRAFDAQGVFSAADLSVMSDSHSNVMPLLSVSREASHSWSGTMQHEINECSGPLCVNTVGEYTFDYPKTKIRKKFPETWIWAQETVSSSGSVDISAEVPDTITEWVATAFAINNKSGLGIAESSSNLTVFLPFFVSLQLPFSIVSGEVAVIQAVVFNYYPYDMYVTVRLKNSSQAFVGMTVNRYGKEEEQKDDIVKCILVKANDAESTYFTLKAVTIGTIDLDVEASSSRGKDTVRRQLLVKAPGKLKEKNVATMISLDNAAREFQTEIPILYPARIVPGSQRVKLSVIGDVFGPSLENLDHLIQLPSGCGEQNMVRFAPAVYAAKYLNVTLRYTDKLVNRIKNVLSTGYQRELLYQRYDGSFSAFGNADKEGSIWLTAFVLKSFTQASEYVFVDPAVIEKAVNYTLKQQNDDGSFNLTGIVHHKAMQGGSVRTKRSLAAYILIALIEVQNREIIENGIVIEKLRKSILSVWSYLNTNIPKMSDDYELAITSYAMALLSRGGSKDLLAKLSSSRNKDEKDNKRYWRDDVMTHEVETAAYVLLALSRQNDKMEGLPILRWLVSQRSPSGGFISTQDTVVALQGLAEFASLIYTADVNMTIDIQSGLEVNEPLLLNADNMDVLQFMEVPAQVDRVTIHASGYGIGLVEVSVFYNVLEEFNNPGFDLQISTNATDVKKFTVKACARWKGGDASGMVLVDFGFPSGFAPVVPFDGPVSTKTFKRHELTDGRLVVYFDEFTSDDRTCVTVEARRDNTVGKVQPADVRVYSYYDTEKSAMKFYLPNILKKNYICDVCGAECGCDYDPMAVPLERCISGYQSKSTIRRGWEPSGWRRRTSTAARRMNTVPTRKITSVPATGSWTRRRTVHLGTPVGQRVTPFGSRNWTRKISMANNIDPVMRRAWTRSPTINRNVAPEIVRNVAPPVVRNVAPVVRRTWSRRNGWSA